MFRIKICGITNIADARLVARSGADAVGLNFYPKSSRYIDNRDARRLVPGLPSHIARVGVFVNASLEEVIRRYTQFMLDWIQVHGDEPPEFLAELGGRPIIRAFRCKKTGLEPVVEYLERCRELDALPDAILLDAYQKGKYGGTGNKVDWKILAKNRSVLGSIPLILAGGLTPKNVGQAIRLVRPDAVDTAGGVEIASRMKDISAVQEFAARSQAAFSNLSD